MLTILKLKEQMEELFAQILDSLNDFSKNPTVKNRRILLENIDEFNAIKNRLASKIRDFWCKGEKIGK